MRVLTTLMWWSNENNNLIELMRVDKREFVCFINSHVLAKGEQDLHES